MENYKEKILNDYQAADFNRRLHIFLDNPRLRPEFLMLDEYDRKNKSLPDTKRGKRPMQRNWSVALVALVHGFKRLWKM